MHIEENFNYSTIKLKDDYDGEAFATLIEDKKNSKQESAILYIHGFIDFFFHPHLADKCINNDLDFYALELRKYGHALDGCKHPNYCKSLDEYFEEITYAITTMKQNGAKNITILGHSTGGLVAALYANRGELKDSVNRLILNSPFLELNAPFLLRKISPSLGKIASSIAPYSKLNGAVSPIYPKSLHKDYSGEWDFNLNYKPIEGFPAYFAWVRAITAGQTDLKRNSKLSIPTLLMYSDHSFIPKKLDDDCFISDIVLNVTHIKKFGDTLSSNLTHLEVKNAIHDIFLSKKEVRENAFDEMFEWLKM